MKLIVLGVVLASLSWTETIAQTTCEQGQLLASDAAPGDAMYPVSISGDTAVVGAVYASSPSAPGSGAAYVFVRNGVQWSQVAKLNASDSQSGSGFGAQVLIRGDTVLISASNQDFRGAVYVFRGGGGSWSQEAKLESSDAPNNFGDAIAFDNETLFVGANNDNSKGSVAGAAYVFQRVGTTWTQTQKILASDGGSGDRFGATLGISGAFAVIGCELRNTAYVFQEVGQIWTQTVLLEPVNGGGNEAYNAVAIDGSTIIVGARSDDQLMVDAGAAYVYTWDGASWNLQTKLVAADGATGDSFGKSVAIEGDRAVVGSIIPPLAAGAAYVFERSGSTWTQFTKLTRPGGTAAQPPEFGRTVDIEGDTVGVGAPGDDSAGVDSGAVYVFLVPHLPIVYCSSKTNSLGCIPAITVTGVPSASSPLPFMIGAEQIISHKFGLPFYGYCALDAPFQGGTLCVHAPILRGPVSMSGGAWPPNECSGAFAYNFNSLIQSGTVPGLVAGATVYTQYWYRDPADAYTTGLTDAVVFTIGA